MAAPYLATPEDLALLTNLSAASPALLLALDRASNRFRAAVGHPVHRVEDDSVVLDGGGGVTLLLPAAPCDEVTLVKIDGVEVTDFTVSLRAGVLRRKNGWPDGLGNVEVTFTHGYDPIPGAVQDAVLEQAAIQALVPVAAVQQETAGPQSVTWGLQSVTGITQKWADAVARYRIGEGDRQ